MIEELEFLLSHLNESNFGFVEKVLWSEEWKGKLIYLFIIYLFCYQFLSIIGPEDNV